MFEYLLLTCLYHLAHPHIKKYREYEIWKIICSNETLRGKIWNYNKIFQYLRPSAL